MVSIKYSEILFYLFFGLLLFAKGVGLYDGQAVFKLVLIMSGMCFALKLCLEKYNWKQLIIIPGILFLGGVTYLLSGEKGLLLNCMILVGMHNIDSRKVFKVAAGVWGTSVAISVISSLFHMEDTVYKVHDKLGFEHVFRWSLGYGHPNVLQITYLILAIIVVYLLGKNFKLWHAGVLFLGNCFFFMYSLSYTGFITVMCLIVGRVYLLYRPKLCMVEKTLLHLFFPACLVLSLVAPCVLEGQAFHILNELMNTRLGLAKHFLSKEFIHLWGNRLSEITSVSLTMDNAYVFAFIVYGIIPFVIIVGFTIYVIYILMKKEDYVGVLIFLVIAVGGLTEPFLYNTSFKNLSVILMGEVLFEKISGNEKYKLFAGLNKAKNFSEETIRKVNAFTKRVGKYGYKKVLFVTIGAALICLISNYMISYPEGYVVYREDCANLEKVFHYYGEEEYEGYREMEDFKPGELVEYYGGSIVTVEIVRNSIMAFLLGFAVLYIGYGVCESLKEKPWRNL